MRQRNHSHPHYRLHVAAHELQSVTCGPYTFSLDVLWQSAFWQPLLGSVVLSGPRGEQSASNYATSWLQLILLLLAEGESIWVPLLSNWRNEVTGSAVIAQDASPRGTVFKSHRGQKL